MYILAWSQGNAAANKQLNTYENLLLLSLFHLRVHWDETSYSVMTKIWKIKIKNKNTFLDISNQREAIQAQTLIKRPCRHVMNSVFWCNNLVCLKGSMHLKTFTISLDRPLYALISTTLHFSVHIKWSIISMATVIAKRVCCVGA